MKTLYLCFLIMLSTLLYLNCDRQNSQVERIEFDTAFFKKYVPESPEVRLLKKGDLPDNQQLFFDDGGSQLQLLADLNSNGIPEYIITGICDICIANKVKQPYLIAIFERENDGIKRLFFQRVFIPPVNIKFVTSDSTPSIIISFAYNSDYGAEIYFQDDEYHLEIW